MKSFLKFAATFAVILLLSVVLAPVLHSFLPYKFERIFNRLVMIFSLVAIALFLRINRKDWQGRLGLHWEKRNLVNFGIAFAMALLILAVMSGVKVASGYAGFSLEELPAWQWVWESVRFFATALLIATLEEFFFRGFVYTKLSSFWSRSAWPALFLTNIFYALIHFVNVKKPFIDDSPSLRDGVRLLLSPFLSMTRLPSFWEEAFGLFLFGLILTDLFGRTRSLYASIGLHAGGVFFVKMDHFFVDILREDSFLYGSKKILDGILGWAFLFLLWVLLRMTIKQAELNKRPALSS